MRQFSLVLIAGNVVVFFAACVWPAGASLEVCRVAIGLCDYPCALFVTLLVWTGLFFLVGDEI
jgi:hypothetical protein